MKKIKIKIIRRKKRKPERPPWMPKNHVWFYWDGWRVGKIIKKYSDVLMTVKDCNGTRHKVGLNSKDKWVSLRHKEFKGQKYIRKEKKDVKNKIKKSKPKGKRRFKVKITKRKVRKSVKRSKPE